VSISTERRIRGPRVASFTRSDDPPSRPFTAREREVAALIAASRTTKQIAAYLRINEQRVRQLVDAIAAKIDADTSGDRRVVIALWWREHAA
jgi:DNA-binding CsgD family transcriptional regulator